MYVRNVRLTSRRMDFARFEGFELVGPRPWGPSVAAVSLSARMRAMVLPTSASMSGITVASVCPS
ncbi:hypothetical protein ABIB90_001078 [Bradyrhizobium sp. JR4.1]